MGKIEERADGSFILETKIGGLTIKKAFKEVNQSDVSADPKENGFYLDIPDREIVK